MSSTKATSWLDSKSFAFTARYNGVVSPNRVRGNDTYQFVLLEMPRKVSTLER